MSLGINIVLLWRNAELDVWSTTTEMSSCFCLGAFLIKTFTHSWLTGVLLKGAKPFVLGTKLPILDTSPHSKPWKPVHAVHLLNLSSLLLFVKVHAPCSGLEMDQPNGKNQWRELQLITTHVPFFFLPFYFLMYDVWVWYTSTYTLIYQFTVPSNCSLSILICTPQSPNLILNSKSKIIGI